MLFVNTVYFTHKINFRALDVPMNKVDVRVLRVGGGFGGKVTKARQVSAAAAIAAAKVGAPVRLVLSLQDNMKMMGKRSEYYFTYRVRLSKTIGDFASLMSHSRH